MGVRAATTAAHSIGRALASRLVACDASARRVALTAATRGPAGHRRSSCDLRDWRVGATETRTEDATTASTARPRTSVTTSGPHSQGKGYRDARGPAGHRRPCATDRGSRGSGASPIHSRIQPHEGFIYSHRLYTYEIYILYLSNRRPCRRCSRADGAARDRLLLGLSMRSVTRGDRRARFTAPPSAAAHERRAVASRTTPVPPWPREEISRTPAVATENNTATAACQPL